MIEPWELLYFKVYKRQLPVIERALETAALMLGSDKSRGYCLEMICADFLAGAHLDDVSPDTLSTSLKTLIAFLSSKEEGRIAGSSGTSRYMAKQTRQGL